jgi:hypothetical protein
MERVPLMQQSRRRWRPRGGAMKGRGSGELAASARLFHRSLLTKYYQTWLVNIYSTGEELYTFSWPCYLLFVYINL